MPGTSRQTSADLDAYDAAQRLGRFVRALQAIETAGAAVAEEHAQRDALLAACDEVTRAALDAVVARMDAGRLDRDLLDPWAAREPWDAAVGAPAWQAERVWLHRDLHLDNLLATVGGRAVW